MMRHELSPDRRLAQADLLLWAARPLAGPRARRGDDWIVDAGSLEQLAGRSGLAGVAGGSAALRRLAAAARVTDPAARGSEYTRLFEGGLPCPPNETAYVRRDKGVLLADIAGFYRAFGFTLAEDAGEKADHVVAELQFVGLLLVMLAQADSAGDREAAEVTHRALASFSEDHLDAWLPAFCDRLEQTAILALYVDLAALLRLVWQLVVDDHRLPRAPGVGTGDDVDSGSPYECGLCPDAKGPDISRPPDPR